MGPFRANLDGQPVSSFASDKVRALLAYLAVEDQRPHSREGLTALFWPEFDPQHARANFRNSLSNLKSVIKDYDNAHPRIIADRETVQLNTKSDYFLDVNEFCDLVQLIQLADKAQSAIPTDLVEFRDTTTGLLRINELYQGEFLEGFSLPDCSEFDEWLSIRRERLKRQVIRALYSLVNASAIHGDYASALHFAQRQVELEPWLEEAHQQIMLISALDGRRSEALDQFSICKKLLKENLAVEPGDETIRLYEYIRDRKFPARNTPPGFLLLQSTDTVVEKRFFARKDGLDRLDHALDLALTGKGQVRFISGNPGQGKTALALEFIRRAMSRHKRLAVVQGICHSIFGLGDAFKPFRDVMGMLAGDVEDAWLAGAVTTDQARRCWLLTPLTAQALVEKGPALIDTLVSGSGIKERLFQSSSLAGTWFDRLQPSGTQQSQPQVDQQSEFFSQYINVLRQVARDFPLVIFLDDLQWADASSLSLLFLLAREIGNSPILLIGAFRPDDAPGEARTTSPQLTKIVNELQILFNNLVIDMDALEESSLIDEYLDSEPNHFDKGFREALFACTRGHPLLMIELVQAMRDRLEIVKDSNGGWVASPILQWDHLSPRIEAIIKEQVTKLPVELQNLLETASVEGERFSLETLAELLASSPHQVNLLLRQEMKRPYTLIQPDTGVKTGEQSLTSFRFRHHLFQQYFYQKLDRATLAYLHRRCAGVLEKHAHDCGDEITLKLAYHYQEAGLFDKAAHCYFKVGNNAAMLAANASALDNYQNTLRLISNEDILSRYTILLKIQRLHARTGQRQANEFALRELADLADQLGPVYQMQVKLRRAESALAGFDHQTVYDNASAVVQWAENLEKAPEKTTHSSGRRVNAPSNNPDFQEIPNPKRLEAKGLYLLGCYHQGIFFTDSFTSQSRTRLAQPCLERALEIATSGGFPDLELEIMRLLVFIYLGENVEKAIQIGRQALELAHLLGDRYHEGRILNVLGDALVADFQYMEAFNCFRRGRERCRQTSNPYDESWAIHRLTQFYQLVGRLDLILEDLLKLQDDAVALGHIYLHSWSNFVIAYHYYLVDDFQTALSYAEKCLDLINEYRMVGQPLETTLGMNAGIQEKLSNFKRAKELYQETETMTRNGCNLGFLHIPLAGLARLAFQEADLEKATSLVDEFLPLLKDRRLYEDGKVMDSYAIAYQILSACGNPRAIPVLKEAVEKIHSTAKQIADEEWQKMFFERNRYNAWILLEWSKVNEEQGIKGTE